jgi:uncharacterized protein
MSSGTGARPRSPSTDPGTGPGHPAGSSPKHTVELTRPECLSLLAGTGLGRLVVALGEMPVIRPVNYIFDERSQSVVFGTAEGSKFYALVHAATAAFEIDSVDQATQTGWSVIIVGVTEEVTHPTDVQRLSHLGLRTWAPGPKPHWIRIRARTVSGRRIVSGSVALSSHQRTGGPARS